MSSWGGGGGGGGRRGGYRQDNWSNWNNNGGNGGNGNYNNSRSYTGGRNTSNNGGYNSNSYNSNGYNSGSSNAYGNSGYNSYSSRNGYNSYNSNSRGNRNGSGSSNYNNAGSAAYTSASSNNAGNNGHASASSHNALADSSNPVPTVPEEPQTEWYCPLCDKYLGNKTLPFLEAVLIELPSEQEVTKRCHFSCLLTNFPTMQSEKYRFGDDFAQSFERVLQYSPRLREKATQLRICFEEDHLNRAAAGLAPITFPQPSVPPPPPMCWRFEGLVEVRISGCDTLTTLPPEVGNMRKLRSMVLISNNLETLPEELGKLTDIENLFVNGNFLRQLPASLGNMLKLKEVCFDANCLESIPPLRSEKLILLTAPGNKLRSMPVTAARLGRIELHGNLIDDPNLNSPEGMSADWSKLTTLKVMGNQLPMVPPQIESMKALQIIALAGNRITELPDCIADMRWLEWVYVYDNLISSLPSQFISRARRLARMLLEANPLPKATVEELIAEARDSENLRTLGLDYRQVENISNPEAVPAVALGTVIPVPGHGQYWMKLHVAPNKKAEPSQKPLLIVAFSASQGEPEWMGLLRKLRDGVAKPLPENSESLSALFRTHNAETDDDKLAALWSDCCVGPPKVAPTSRETMPIPEFDILSVVDHRMRWYSEDAEHFGQTLQSVARDYSRVLFLGASMGGFGSLLHSGEIADAVVAFSPQANLCEACLRPPAESRPALQALCTKMMSSAQRATARGASLTVHCAADEHFLHALSLPEGSVDVVVHPMVPRKPFARILDGGGVLMPIVQDAVWRVLQRPSNRDKDAVPGQISHSEGWAAPTSIGSSSGATLSVASWVASGDLKRYSSTPFEVLKLLIKDDDGPPRPGDWFCKACRKRNMSVHFFCWQCPIEAQSHMAVEGTPKIPENHYYPQSGDWGCASCREANCNFQKKCKKCWELKTSNRANFIQP